jgi:hypothetical protein
MTKTNYSDLLKLKTKPSEKDTFLKKVHALKEGDIKRLTYQPLSKHEATKQRGKYHSRLYAQNLTPEYGIVLKYTKAKKAHIWLVHWKKNDLEKVAEVQSRYKVKKNYKINEQSYLKTLVSQEMWEQLTPEQWNTTISQLDLSSRTLHCLERASLETVGQILETEKADLLKIRNFGVKCLNELNDKFRTMGFFPEGFSWINEEEPAEPAKPVKPAKPYKPMFKIRSSRYAEEHNAPAMNLIEEFISPNNRTVPKVPQMTIASQTHEPNYGTLVFDPDESPLDIPRVSNEEVEKKKKEVISEIEKDYDIKIENKKNQPVVKLVEKVKNHGHWNINYKKNKSLLDWFKGK